MEDVSFHHLTIALVGMGLAVVLTLWLRRHYQQSTIKITRIFVHPIKSCRGTSLQEARYTPQGLEYDRTFMIVDKSTHRMITARDVPKLVLVHPHVEENRDSDTGGILRIQFPVESGIEPVCTPLWPKEGILKGWERLEDTQIWKHTTDAYVCKSIDPQLADPSPALSRYLEKEVLLVFKGPKTRQVGPPDSFPDLEASAVFQDGWPVLVATEESLIDVQQKVALSASGKDEQWALKGVSGEWKGEIVMERFRPNIVLSGVAKPFAEDEWAEIGFKREESPRYGRMLLVSKCTRCQFPNIEPTTGEKDAHVPYKVLAKYRRVHPTKPFTPCFGVNAVPGESGTYRVGDRVSVIRYAPEGELPAKK